MVCQIQVLYSYHSNKDYLHLTCQQHNRKALHTIGILGLFGEEVIENSLLKNV